MSTAKFTTLSNLDASKTVPVDTVVSGSAKAWVNFNGTGTVAIRAAFNVSSITDNGTGDYTVNFTNAMPDANYNIVGSICGNLGVRPGGFIGVNTYGAGATEATPVVGSVRITTMDGSNSIFDAKYVNVAIFR